jgi:hypothetical protein
MCNLFTGLSRSKPFRDVANDRQLEPFVLVSLEKQQEPQREFRQKDQSVQRKHQQRYYFPKRHKGDLQNNQYRYSKQTLDTVEPDEAIPFERLNQKKRDG